MSISSHGYNLPQYPLYQVQDSTQSCKTWTEHGENNPLSRTKAMTITGLGDESDLGLSIREFKNYYD